MSLKDRMLKPDVTFHEIYHQRYHEILATSEDPDNPLRRRIAAMTALLELTSVDDI